MKSEELFFTSIGIRNLEEIADSEVDKSFEATANLHTGKSEVRTYGEGISPGAKQSDPDLTEN